MLLGAGVCVLGPIEIDPGSKVGAGSVVVTDLPCHCVAVGVPARIIRQSCVEEPCVNMDLVSARHSFLCLLCLGFHKSMPSTSLDLKVGLCSYAPDSAQLCLGQDQEMWLYDALMAAQALVYVETGLGGDQLQLFLSVCVC